MPHRVARFRQNREQLGEVDFLGRLAVIVKERVLDLGAATQEGVVQTADPVDPLRRACGCDLRTPRLLPGKNAIDLRQCCAMSEPRIDRHRPRILRQARPRILRTVLGFLSAMRSSASAGPSGR